MGSEDAACNRLTELALNDVSMAGSILAEAVSSSTFAVAAVESAEAHEAFQKVSAVHASLTCQSNVFEGLLKTAMMPVWYGCASVIRHTAHLSIFCCKAIMRLHASSRTERRNLSLHGVSALAWPLRTLVTLQKTGLIPCLVTRP